MPEATPFTELMARVRLGDADAAAELVRKYEPAIRVVVRARLIDPKLRRHFDSIDVCQSVLGSFFVRAAAGQFDLSNPEQLVALLAQMTRNKVAMQARYHRQAKRDARRVAGDDEALGFAADTGPSPTQLVAGRELFAAVLARLTSDEREMVQRRSEGQEWNQIAAEMGGTPEARRKQLARAISRVGGEFDLVGAE